MELLSNNNSIQHGNNNQNEIKRNTTSESFIFSGLLDSLQQQWDGTTNFPNLQDSWVHFVYNCVTILFFCSVLCRCCCCFVIWFRGLVGFWAGDCIICFVSCFLWTWCFRLGVKWCNALQFHSITVLKKTFKNKFS